MVANRITFESLGLDPRLLRALAKKHFVRPTAVQAACISEALEGKDVVARARTGSGKTLAYVLPALQKLLLMSAEPLQAPWQVLILVPTKELCEQVKEEVDYLVFKSGLEIKATALTASGMAQSAQFLHVGQIVVATPGRVAQALRSGKLRSKMLQPSEQPKWPGLSSLILDEADLILSMPGYEKDLQELAPKIPRACQCMLMSATSNASVDKLEKLILHNPITLDLLQTNNSCESQEAAGPGSAAEIEHFVLHVEMEDKQLCVMSLLKLGMVDPKILIFVNSIEAGLRLRMFLESFGIKSAVINAELPLNSRHHILQEFNHGLFDHLIATDDTKTLESALDKKGKHLTDDSKRGKKRKLKEIDSEFGVTRGIDFRGVHTVINMDAPSSVQQYVHRVGRTGRAGNWGTAVTILSPADGELEANLRQQLSPSSSGKGGIQSFQKPVKKAMEALRYRAEDVARSLTKKVIKEARAKELRLELLNSKRLASHFEQHPGDLALLKHDKALASKPQAPHLKHVPAYLTADGVPISTDPGARLLAKKRRKLSKGLDPIKGVFLKAPKAGHASEPFTEVELKAEELGKKMARKHAKALLQRPFVPKRNVRKKR